MNSYRYLLRMLAMLFVLSAMAACGGSGGSPDSDSNDNSTTGNNSQPDQTSGQLQDADDDGVEDSVDQCPNTPEGDAADPSDGCSSGQLDDDEDGVANSADQCPDSSGDVNGAGCDSDQQQDLDGDGVANDDDDCPNTPAGATVDSMGCPPANTRSGTTTQVNLDSDVDGENIAFTVHEPTAFTPGEKYPLILHSHGYGGSRQSARPTGGLLGTFLDNGYAVLSLDERGHNDSGGTIRILDPDFAGKDWLQVLDWTEDNLDWMEYRDNNPLMGAVGGSYGGGFQHLIYAIDPDHRLDAIAPDITWHNLLYSLFAGDVFKTFWAGLLSGVGNNPNNTQDSQVNGGLVQGAATNSLGDTEKDLLYRNSLASHCANENDSTAPGGLTQIDAFLTQSHLDTLFNFNDMLDNYNCLNALGGDVRLFTKSAGHGIDNGDGGQNCGGLGRDDATFAWYEEKLKGITDAADMIPEFCLNLSKTGDDAITPASITVGGDAFDVTATLLTLQEGSQQIAYVDLYTAPAGGSVLAGVPEIDLSMAHPALGTNSPGDPIVFIGVGVRPDGGNNPTAPLMNQVRPVRGYAVHDTIELNGVMERLAENDTVVLMFHAAHAQQYPSSGSTAASPAEFSGTVRLPILAND